MDDGQKKTLTLRRVVFWDNIGKRLFVYITNLFDLRADLIVALYKIRWQVELLFYGKYIVMQSKPLLQIEAA